MNSVPVEVTGISVYSPYHGYAVILKDKKRHRWLPIFIGGAEAQTISFLLQGVKIPRPLTYDLFQTILEQAGARIERVEVTDLRDNTFFAEVAVRVHNGELRLIDARPSDSIALALKTSAPLFVSEQIMIEASMVGDITVSAQPDANDRIQELNRQLEAAVSQEEYEEAAKIRDMIKALEDSVRAS